MILPTTYYTLDNSSNPFKVSILDNHVWVYKNKIFKKNSKLEDYDYDNVDNNFPNTPFREYDTEQVFIGKSVDSDMTRQCDTVSSYYDGNSILLKMLDNTYIHIGTTIKSFTTPHEITKLVAQVGNNEVPSPYAVDDQQNIYMIDDNYILCKHSIEDYVMSTGNYGFLVNISEEDIVENNDICSCDNYKLENVKRIQKRMW